MPSFDADENWRLRRSVTMPAESKHRSPRKMRIWLLSLSVILALLIGVCCVLGTFLALRLITRSSQSFYGNDTTDVLMHSVHLADEEQTAPQNFSVIVEIFREKIVYVDRETVKNDTGHIDKGCIDTSCLNEAAQLLSAMNRSSNVCNDALSFAAGNMAVVPQSGGIYRRENYDSQLEESRRLLERGTSKIDSNAPSWRLKLHGYYTSCVTREETVAIGVRAIRQKIYHLGGWSKNVESIDFGDWDHSSFNIRKALVASRFKLMSSPFFRVETAIDPGAQYVKLLIKGYTVEPCKKYKRPFKQYLEKIAQVLEPNSYVDTFVNGVHFIISSLCKVRNSDLTTTPFTLDALQGITKGIDWVEFLKTRYRVNSSTTVVVTREALAKLSIIGDMISGNQVPERNMRDYMAYRFIEDNMVAMPRAIQDRFIELNDGAVFIEAGDEDKLLRGGALTLERDWRSCLSYHLDTMMPLALIANLDRKKSRSSIADKKVSGIVADIYEVVKNDLQSMSSRVASMTIARMSHRRQIIGGPSWMLSDDELNNYYQRLQVAHAQSYLLNYIEAKKFHEEKEAEYTTLAITDKFSVARSLRLFHGPEESSDNIFLVPTWAMEPPLYHHEFAPFMNIGGLGFYVARKIYEEYYNLALDESIRAQSSLAEDIGCMKKCLSSTNLKTSLLDLSDVSALRTLIDLDAIKAVIKVFNTNKTMTDNDVPYVLRQLGYTNEQLLIINIIQTWYRSEITRSATDMARVRLRVIMASIPEITNIFRIECGPNGFDLTMPNDARNCSTLLKQ